MQFYCSSLSDQCVQFSVGLCFLQYDANGRDDAPNDARDTPG